MNRIPTIITTSALAGGLILGLGACAQTDPCASLGAPSAAELAVARSGGDIDREVNGTECELVNGDWVEEGEDGSAYGSSHRSTKTVTSAPRTSSPKTTVRTAPKSTSRPAAGFFPKKTTTAPKTKNTSRR